MTRRQQFALSILGRVAIAGAGVGLISLLPQWPLDRGFLLFMASLPVVGVTALVDWRHVRALPKRLVIVGGAAVVFLVPSFVLLSGRGWGSLPFLVVLVVLVTALNGVMISRMDRRQRT
ncbi:MAG: hypothetical protein WAS07_05285 [Micropruina sp.]